MDADRKIASLANWKTYAVIALLLSLLGAVAGNVYDCNNGTHEQCMISKGLFPIYWAVGLLVAWPLVALLGSALKDDQKD